MINLSIETFFATIKKRKWHNITDLSAQLIININTLIELSKVLSQNGIVTYEESKQRIKMKPEWNDLLPINEEETHKSLVQIFLAPQTCVNIESTKIINTSDLEVQITLIIDQQINEIAMDVLNDKSLGK